MAGKSVRVVSPEGDLYEVDESELSAAVKQGYRLESRVREEQLQDEYGGAGGGLLAGAQGAARGLTLGLSDMASAGLTGLAHTLTGGDDGPALTPEARERMAGLGIDAPEERGGFATGYDAAQEYQEGLREANKGIAIGSEIGGALLGALGTGGGALAASPAALAERAGAAVSRGVSGAAPGVGRAMLGGAAAGAVEGGIAGLTLGASQLSSQQWQDPGEVAEHLLSTAGEGLLLGGGIGAVLGGGARALQGGAQRLDDAGVRLTPKPAPAAAVVDDPNFADVAISLQARPLTANAIPDPARGKWAAALERQQAAQGGFDDAVQEGTRAVRKEFDDVLRSMDVIDENAGIAAKMRANKISAAGEKKTYKADPKAAEYVDALNASAEPLSDGSRPLWRLVDVPIDRIEAPATWDATKLGRVRQGLESGDVMPAVRLDVVDDGKIAIRDGIHRVAAAREAGLSHVPAIVEEAIPPGGSPVRFDGFPVSQSQIDGLLSGLEGDILQWQAGRSRQGLVSGGGLSAIEGIKKSLKQNAELIRSALQKGDVGEAYSLLDQGVKGFLGKARTSTRAAPVQDMIEGLYPRVQSFLEDESLWGELAQRQKMANPAWAERIGVSKDARVRPFTLVAGERGANGWDNLRLANDGAIKGLLSQLGDAGSEATEQAFRTQLRAYARDAAARTQAWGSPELQAQAVKVTNAVKRIEDQLDRVALLRRDAIAGQRQLTGSSVELAASAAGAVAPPVGWAITGAAQASRRLLATAAEAGSGTAAKVATSAARLVRGAGKAAAVGALTAPVAATGASRGMLARDKHDAAVEEAQQLASAGSPATQELVRQAAEIEQQDPELADAYASRTLQRAAFIAQKLPKPPETGVAIFAPKPALDPVTDRSLRRSVAAATEPAAALERIVRSAGSPEDVEALRKVYPAMYASFVRQVQEHLQRLPEPPDYATRVRIAQITGLPVDPSMRPLSIARAQQASTLPDQQKQAEGQAKQTRQARQKRGPSMSATKRDRDSVYAPRTDQLLNRG